MNQLYVIDSVFHIYVSILLSYKNHRDGNASILIIIEDETPNISSYAKPLRNLKIFEDVVCIKAKTTINILRKHTSKFSYIFKRSTTLKVLFEIINPHILKHHEFILNAEINMFHMIASKAYFFIKYPKNNFRMIEEGIGTYTKKARKLRRLKRKLLGFPQLMGYDPQVSEILVQEPKKMIDPILRGKSKVLNLTALLNQISEEEKKDIFDCFNSGNLELYSKEKKAIILTQPLITAGFDVTKEKMISIYNTMIRDAQKRGMLVYLKLHPREEIDYEAIFKPLNIKIISRTLPIEVMNMNSAIFFDEAYTICSGAIDNLLNVGIKHNLGINYLKKKK